MSRHREHADTVVRLVATPTHVGELRWPVDGQPSPAGTTGTLRVLLYDIDHPATGHDAEWAAHHRSQADARLSPAAARHVHTTIDTYLNARDVDDAGRTTAGHDSRIHLSDATP